MKTRRDFLKMTAGGGIAGIIASGAAPALASGTKDDISMEDAQRVHDKCLIIDGHNDTPVKRIARGENPMTWQVHDTVNYHTDIPRMKEGGYDGGFCGRPSMFERMMYPDSV